MTLVIFIHLFEAWKYDSSVNFSAISATMITERPEARLLEYLAILGRDTQILVESPYEF